MKRLILDALSSERLFPITAPLTRTHGIIFFGHRFADEEFGISGHDPDVLRRDLELLRRNRFNITSLDDVVQRLREGVPLLPRTVVFTIDDGYADYARVAAPIFAAFDCPVTVFLTTGFLDRKVWMWWDQIAFVLRETGHSSVSLEAGSVTIHERWSTLQDREAAAGRIGEILSHVADEEKWRVIDDLARVLEVDRPTAAPTEFLPMTWDEVRACERRGASFGPHTVTHPILSQVDDRRARSEIVDSWTRLQGEVARPVPVFCYPDGSASAYSARDAANVRDAGLAGAVTTLRRYVDTSSSRDESSLDLYNLPRLSYPEPGQESTFAHMVSGLERGKLWARRRLGARGQAAR